MSRGARVLLAVVLVGLVAGAVASVVGRGGPSYDASLVRHEDERGEANRYADLPDGEAQLAIGSPDGHRVVVQFRDPDGSGWTAPETVWEDEVDTFIDTTLRYGGGTVGTSLLFTPDTGSESDAENRVVGLVCRGDGATCTARRLPGISSDPQVAPDGRTVLFAQSRRGVVQWTEEDGFLESAWSGHPGFPDYGEPGEQPSEPLLSPDGSLTVATSVPAGDGCDLRLLRAPRGTADLVEVAAETVDVRLDSRADVDADACGTRLSTFSDDWVRVDFDGANSDPVWFVRVGEDWEATRDDPSGLELIESVGRCCGTLVTGFISWNDVAFGTPDGRTVQVQTHFLGAEEWTEPQVLGEGLVPEDAQCEELYEGYEIGDGAFAIVMPCDAGEESGALVVASADLEDWEAEYVVTPDPAFDVDEETDRLVVGPLTWSAEDGFDRG